METNPEVLDWFAANAPNWPAGDTCYEAPTLANPYLRWPVILDEYVKNRAVWQCPSARNDNVAGSINPSPDWLAAVVANKERMFVQGWGGLCPLGSGWWPKGWGGAITDSFQQGVASGDPEAFRITIGVNGGLLPTSGEGYGELWINRGRRVTGVLDPASFVTCGDSGSRAALDALTLGMAAYPDLCHVSCAGACTSLLGDASANPAMMSNQALLKPYARHFGGNNLGFLDGHAAWWDSQRLIGEFASRSRKGDNRPLGLFMVGPTSADLNSDADSPGTLRSNGPRGCKPDTPTLW
jgi:hypothetical protein